MSRPLIRSRRDPETPRILKGVADFRRTLDVADFRRTLGAAVRAAIDASGKTYAEVSRNLGMDPAQLQGIMRGESDSRASTLIAIADETGASVDSLLGRGAPPTDQREDAQDLLIMFRRLERIAGAAEALIKLGNLLTVPAHRRAILAFLASLLSGGPNGTTVGPRPRPPRRPR
jgi:transcriptional regulator with XRE-family HTH domain